MGEENAAPRRKSGELRWMRSVRRAFSPLAKHETGTPPPFGGGVFSECRPRAGAGIFYTGAQATKSKGEYTMKKRVAALLMALVMLVGLLPSAVWAEVAVTPRLHGGGVGRAGRKADLRQL